MTTGPTIAILGISGVGKSRLASRLVNKRPEFIKLSAGRLLREALHTTGKELRTASSDNVLRNQHRLVAAFESARDGRQEQPVLLEAHAFIDNDRELVDVPVEVMRALNVSGILALVAPPEIIYARRLSDTNRLRPARTADDLGRQQEHMLKLARRYAQMLPARLSVVDSGDLSEALVFADSLLKSIGIGHVKPLTKKD